MGTAERARLGGALYVRFGQSPSLAKSIWLRTWRGTPEAKWPKIPAAVANMLACGLLELRPARFGLAAYFTEAGFPALRLLAQDYRALKPMGFAHVRQQLGLDLVLTEPPGYPEKLG